MDKKSHNTISDKAALPQKNHNRNTKNFNIIKHFATSLSLHRFQAERLGDHVLPSTISELQKLHGMYFKREVISVHINYNCTTRFKKYWFAGEPLVNA